MTATSPRPNERLRESLLDEVGDHHDALAKAELEVDRLRTARNEYIAQAYASGVNIPEMAARMGVSAEAVSKILGRPRSTAAAARADLGQVSSL